MDTSSLLMVAAAVIAVIAVYVKSPKAAESGVGAGLSLLIEIAPRMIAAFTLAGLVQAVVPQETIVRWMGQGSGYRGLDDRHDLGQRHPGRADDPFPGDRLALQSRRRRRTLGGVPDGLVAFGLQRIIMWELPFLGAKVVAIRVAVSLFFPFFAGWLCELIWDKLNV